MHLNLRPTPYMEFVACCRQFREIHIFVETVACLPDGYLSPPEEAGAAGW